jgi:hypothetical protein
VTGQGTYTKCFWGTSFQPGPPSLRALTRSTSSASWSSTTKSTNWLRSDFREWEEEDESWRKRCPSRGTRECACEASPALLESLRCLPLFTSCCICLTLLFRRSLLTLVGCSRFRLVEAVTMFGVPYSRLSRVARWASMTGYCKNVRQNQA